MKDGILTPCNVAFYICKVDYCSSVLAGISGALLQRLQSVLNAAARLVFSARKSEHINVCQCCCLVWRPVLLINHNYRL